MFKFIQSLFLVTIILSCSQLSNKSKSDDTLTVIKKRGKLICGVNPALRGIAFQTEGMWEGLDVDICRAIATAILGETYKVEYIPLDAAERFKALQEGKIDILVRNSTITFSREANLGLAFGPVVFYDGQGFLVRTRPSILSIKDLKKKTICVQAKTTNSKNLDDYIVAKNFSASALPIDKFQDMIDSFKAGKCHAVSADITALAAILDSLEDEVGEFKIISDIIAKEPLAPVVRAQDAQLALAVRWIVYALIEAEELGIKSLNIDEFLKGKAASRQNQFLNANGAELGLMPNFTQLILKSVGNYGEIYRRHYGQAGLKLDRGANEQWVNGGLMYAPPIQ
jgi:general L-amino acid transport system substrate-binding protein